MAQIVQDRSTVVAEPGDTVVVATSPVARIISAITGVVEALLALRFLLSLLGANPDNIFANLIYSVTYPLVAPFFGLFGYTLKYGVARFEFETLIAMVVYALVGYGLARLANGLRAA